MAIQIEFSNLILRKSAVDAKYPGGLDAFAQRSLPNYLEDDHLLRIGYMSTVEAMEQMDALNQLGFREEDSRDGEMATVSWDDPALLYLFGVHPRLKESWANCSESKWPLPTLHSTRSTGSRHHSIAPSRHSTPLPIALPRPHRWRYPYQ